MFKFPLRRNNGHNRRNRRNQPASKQHHQFATECSDDGFIYIRCDHQYKSSAINLNNEHHNQRSDSQILSNVTYINVHFIL